MNKLGFGFLRLPQTSEQAFDWVLLNNMVDHYMQNGGKYFDTCYTYLDGNSELGIKKCVVERYPRDTFELADKLPGYLCKSCADNRKFFDEELARCGVDYFDVYLLHGLNGENLEIANRYDQFRFLQDLKAAGKVKRIGFSYHDSASLLDEILTAHPETDVVQLQINYLDWDTAGIESGQCYDTCVKHGKQVIVMEPVKGGTLASLPAEAEEQLRKIHPDWTPSDWALRFVQSLPQVEICLSGMSTLEQVRANIQNFAPLTNPENDALWKVRDIIESKTAVPCTGCGYCLNNCPTHIPIPSYFKMYNELFRYPDEDWKIKPTYIQTARGKGKASECKTCHSCEKRCPQHIKIAEMMKEVSKALE